MTTEALFSYTRNSKERLQGPFKSLHRRPTAEEDVESYRRQLRTLPHASVALFLTWLATMTSKSSSLTFFRTSLQSFLSSSCALRILRTLSSSDDVAKARPSQLLVLDSSFNPPTKAHFGIVSSATMNGASEELPKRLVLLLATQNADKPVKPASFEHRLCMMTAFAEDLLESLKSRDRPKQLTVDIGVTKLPYFVEKANALTSSDVYEYEASKAAPVEQVHLIGYDTLIRIMDTKYYPPEHKLTTLASLFQHHRLRVTKHVDTSWGGETEQDRYLQAICDGERDSDGANPKWADRIDLVDSADYDNNAVSSTRAREAAKAGNTGEVERLCTKSVADYVIREGLYSND